MEAFNTFSFVCLMIGLFCAVFSLVLDYQERRRLHAAAIVRRIEIADTRPHFLDTSYPWKHDQWWKL